MKLGIAGAGLIVRTLFEFIHETDIELVAICATPKSFGKLEEYQRIHGFSYIYTDYEEMLKNKEIDTIYVAVNNHLHYEFALKALMADKNVILEKPFTSTYEQALKLADIARQKQLFIIEAISTIHNPNFLMIKDLLPSLGEIKIVSLNYTQYSSRYDAFLNGEILPAFDYKMSGGALMDLNVYNVHFICGLFGEPINVSYLANIEKGVDTSGILSLDYGSFKASLIGAKDCGSPFINSIQGNKGSIFTDCPLFTLMHFSRQLNKEEREDFDLRNYPHRMKQEFMDFQEIFKKKDYETCDKLLDHSLIVMKVLTLARKDAGLRFPDDENI